MGKKKDSIATIKNFLFTVKTSETQFLLLDKIRLLTLYLITLATLFGGIFNIFILLEDEDPLSAFILMIPVLLMIAGVLIFWWKRDIKKIQNLFFVALLIILTDVIVEAGNRYGLGVFYMFSLLSISYLLLNQSYGVFLPLYFFLGMMIRLTLGGYPADSIFNRPDIISRFTVLLGLHVFLVIMAGLLLEYIIAHLYKLALFDQVTQLPNRDKFLEMLEEKEKACSKKKGSFFLLGIKMVRFSQLSPHLSQQKGDELLKETGRRIKQILSSASINSRWSGSLFLSILENVPESEVISLSRELLEILKLPYTLDNHKIKLDFIIGLTQYPGDISIGGSLVENILSLMQLKQQQIDKIHIFDKERLKTVQNRLQLSESMKMADLDTEFHLLYQPKISLQDESCCGAEVLLRWTHPEKGPIAPDEFIPLAEENGMILNISKWLIKKVLKDIGQLSQQVPQSIENLSISINISIQDLKEKDFSSNIAKWFSRYGVPARQVEFEITERVLMDENPFIKKNLADLSEMGFRLSIDDFGTGYSSLSYLQRFPFHSIKIDRSFVSRIESSSDKTYPVIDAIISMALALKLEIIAEGVETEEQARYLTGRCCQSAQGWLYDKGLPLTAFINSLSPSPPPEIRK